MMSVIESIERVKAAAEFDITAYVCPKDDAGFMLEDMRDHYRTLYAIGCAVAPERILSCNLTFGYGAVSLLTAAPSASFEGVHSPVTSSHALDWSEKLVTSFSHALIVASGSRLQHDTYDLTEVSGSGDGDYIFTTLERYACRS